MTPSPEPREYFGTKTCSECGCRWQMYDLSAPNPIEDLCREPVKWHPRGCLCHSLPYVQARLDLQAQQAEEVVATI